MRHKFGNKKLNKTSEHRKAMIQNMLNSLIKYEQITTTLPKAKVLKPKADKIITLGKKGNLSHRRQVLAFVTEEQMVRKVFDDLAARYTDRTGGYTRIVKMENRKGDGSPMALLELIQ